MDSTLFRTFIVCFSIRTPARLLLYLSISLIRSHAHCRALERRRAGLSPARPTLLLSLISRYRTCLIIASANPINIRAPASLNSRQLRPRFPFLSRVHFSFLSFSARSVSKRRRSLSTDDTAHDSVPAGGRAINNRQPANPPPPSRSVARPRFGRALFYFSPPSFFGLTRGPSVCGAHARQR